MTKRRDHAAEIITLKSAEIDNDMISVVRWLNSFPGVFTRHSCIGGPADNQPDDTRSQPPFVVFYCDNEVDLFCVLRELSGYARIEIDWQRGQFRYHVQFCRGTALKGFLVQLDRSDYYKDLRAKITSHL